MPRAKQVNREYAAPLPKAEALVMNKWVESRINQGMITTTDPTNLPLSALQLAKNVTVRFDRTIRRPGSGAYSPNKPDSNAVLKFAFIKLSDGSTHLTRLTATGGQVIVGGVWVDLVPTPALAGSDADFITLIDVLNTIVYSNNGADVPQVIDFAGNTITPLGNNTKRWRTITGFFNRVVGFADRDVNEVEVGWSADGDPTEWDPAVDESAGFSPLVDTPNDISDHIKHGFAFSNVMIILREKSIWLANKQPIPQNPFYFYTAVPGIGCDCPYSAQVITGGLTWADRRTRTVYAYSPGSLPEPIGRPIENQLFDAVEDLDTVFSVYDPLQNEYVMYIPVTGSSVVQAWMFNFRSKAWTYNEYPLVTSSDIVELATGGLSIEDLVGPIESLSGTIEDLSAISTIVATKTFGRSDGVIALEDDGMDVDVAPDFDTVLAAKTFAMPEFDVYIAKVVIEYKAIDTGTILVEYSKDGGIEDDSWFPVKTITVQTGKPRLVIVRKAVRCRKFSWRITTRSRLIEILSYEVHVYESGQSRG